MGWWEKYKKKYFTGSTLTPNIPNIPNIPLDGDENAISKQENSNSRDYRDFRGKHSNLKKNSADNAKVAGTVASGNHKKKDCSPVGEEVAGCHLKKDGEEFNAKTGLTKREKKRLAVIERFRSVAPDTPPMIAENMPDYEHFCKGYQRRECEKCGFFIADSGTGLFCELWEEVFPNVVHWYTKEEVENAVNFLQNER